MQVHDTPLVINAKGATVAVTVGAGGADVYYGASAATASRVNGGTLASAGSTFQVTAPTWVVRSDQSQAPAADLSFVEQAPSTSAGSAGSGGGAKDWAANDPVTANELRRTPDGQLQRWNQATGTIGATYDPSKWTPVAQAPPARGLARPAHIQVPIICLHGEDPTVPVQAGKRRGYTFITIRELYRGLLGIQSLPAKPALLTYDDGHMLQYRTIHPIVQALGVKATLGIVSGFLSGGVTLQAALQTFLGVSFTATTTSSSPQLSAVSNFTNVVVGSIITGTGIPAGTVVGSLNSGAGTIQMADAAGNPVNATASGTAVAITGGATPMTWAMAKSMYDSGTWDIQNHTLTHEQLPTLTSAQRLAQLAQTSTDIIANIGCPPPVCMVYPQGMFNAAVIKDLVQLGFQLGVTVSGVNVVTNSGAGNSSEPSLLPFDTFAVNRSAVTDQTWLDDMVEEYYYDWENDADGGRNANNQLNYWGGLIGAAGSGNAQLYNNGHEMVLIGASRLVFSNDYFRVAPGGRVYYRFNLSTSGQTAGVAGMYLTQYSGKSLAKTVISDLPLKEVTTTTGLAAFEGEVTVDPTARYVRPVMKTDSAFPAGAILKVARASIRPPRI